MACVLLQPVDRANLALEKTKLAAILKDTNEEAAKKYRAAYAAIWLARLHVHEGSIAQVHPLSAPCPLLGSLALDPTQW